MTTAFSTAIRAFGLALLGRRLEVRECPLIALGGKQTTHEALALLGTCPQQLLELALRQEHDL